MEERILEFSKRERVGILAMSIVIALVFAANYFYTKKSIISDSEDLAFHQAISEAHTQKENEKSNKKSKYIPNKYSQPAKKKSSEPKTKNSYSKKQASAPKQDQVMKEPEPLVLKPFEFNPNIISKDELQSIGLPAKVINIMMNYRSKGGKFFSKKDFRKIYGVTDEIFDTLENYIIIPKKEFTPKLVKNIKKLDMNLADGPTWDKLYRITPYLSNRIVDYREELGGYIRKSQLLEDNILPDSIFQAIEPYLHISTSIDLKNLNNLSFKELVAHPYIQKPLAGKIITYLDRNGKFKDFTDFEKYLKITPKQVENIRAYFIIQ